MSSHRTPQHQFPTHTASHQRIDELKGTGYGSIIAHNVTAITRRHRSIGEEEKGSGLFSGASSGTCRAFEAEADGAAFDPAGGRRQETEKRVRTLFTSSANDAYFYVVGNSQAANGDRMESRVGTWRSALASCFHCPAHRTGLADFQHPALGSRIHEGAHEKLCGQRFHSRRFTKPSSSWRYELG